mmetsp:Transcript_30261/g.56777  ORF Transcript_30261/g.56777 Transcript_30261/m.56777 type:complete len:92 (+) Transcript_30261:476-751(+)
MKIRALIVTAVALVSSSVVLGADDQGSTKESSRRVLRGDTLERETVPETSLGSSQRHTRKLKSPPKGRPVGKCTPCYKKIPNPPPYCDKEC